MLLSITFSAHVCAGAAHTAYPLARDDGKYRIPDINLFAEMVGTSERVDGARQCGCLPWARRSGFVGRLGTLDQVALLFLVPLRFGGGSGGGGGGWGYVVKLAARIWVECALRVKAGQTPLDLSLTM